MFENVLHAPGHQDSGEINSYLCSHGAKELKHRIRTKNENQSW